MSLINTLGSGVSALDAFTEGLQVIGNNISNINTTAYKSSSTSYSDTFSETLQAASPGSDTASMQVGTGVQVSGIKTDYTQGSISETGTTTDLAISGNGYFVVEDTANSTNYATRDGAFHFNSSGYLVNSEGYEALDTTGSPISIANCTSTSGGTITYANVASVTIGTDGTITAYDSSGTAYTGQKVGVLNVSSQEKLLKKGDNLYDFSATGATIASNLSTAGTGSLGTIQSGYLEESNVDLTKEFSEMITAQRSFQAASRLVTVSDTILEEIVNLKRQ